MEADTKISLVRHGQVHNPEAVFYGRLPRFGISRLGQRQARLAAQALERASLAAVFSSPLLRARQTAAVILTAHPQLRMRLSKQLLEVYTPWEGRPAAEVDERHGDVYSGIGPPFEQPADVVRRVQLFIKRMRREYAGRHIVAVTHGDVIAFTLLAAVGRPLEPRRKAALQAFGVSDGYPATGSITTFLYDNDSVDARPRIHYLRPA